MKSPQAFRSIGEVARLVGVATHVLRYWETQFPTLAPVRRPDGRRYYRPDDLLLAAGLCEVMREDGLTIRGARRLIEMDKGAALRERGRLRLDAALAPPTDSAAAAGRRRTNGGAKAAARRRGKAGGTQPAAAVDGAGAPPAHRPAPAATAGHAMNNHAGTAGTWLGRLNATASALRASSGPLPPAADALARALHSAWTRRS